MASFGNANVSKCHIKYPIVLNLNSIKVFYLNSINVFYLSNVHCISLLSQQYLEVLSQYYQSVHVNIILNIYNCYLNSIAVFNSEKTYAIYPF